MSHVTEVKVKVRDLDALEAASETIGLSLKRDKKNFSWYGRFVGDTVPPAGRDPRDYGKCDHVLQAKDHRDGDYEIGVVKALDGDGYDLMFDYWGPGKKLADKCGGTDLKRIKQEYSYEVARKRAKEMLAKKGWIIGERVPLGGGRFKFKARKP